MVEEPPRPLWVFENIMGLPVKTNLAAVKLKVDLVLGLEKEVIWNV